MQVKYTSYLFKLMLACNTGAFGGTGLPHLSLPVSDFHCKDCLFFADNKHWLNGLWMYMKTGKLQINPNCI